jgi:putative NIF3 family GTP cyclohydrolase 1 type 2
MTTLKALLEYTNDLLSVDRFRDYAPNGLQVEGRAQVNAIVSGVTASVELLEQAIAAQADAILVHHGYFWKGEDPCVTGMKRRRLARLLEQLARVLELSPGGTFGNDADMPPAQSGTLGVPMSGDALARHIGEKLGRTPLHIAGSSGLISTVGWCTGAAQSYIEAAVAQGLDAFISGEISEPTVHIARECGIHYYAAGHHATERYGVQALGAHLAGHFGLQHRFIDVDNPV